MTRLSGILLILLVAGSCADSPPSGEPLSTDGGTLLPWFPPQASSTGSHTEIAARVRMELPKYRVKGTCAIYRSPDGSVQVDFYHSSLFGSYREDATLFITADSIAIQDNERGIYRGNDETLSHLSEHFVFDIVPEDVIVFMLLGAPALDELDDVASSVSGGKWVLEALWRERQLRIEGREGFGPEMMRICAVDGKGCYEARYSYRSDDMFGGYPEKIVCERKNGTEKLSITVESVEKIID